MLNCTTEIKIESCEIRRRKWLQYHITVYSEMIRGVLVVWYSYNIFLSYDIPTIMISFVTTNHHLPNRSLASTDIQLKTNDKDTTF
jgi:hypothetical protein